jgi:hypothetical protein
MLHNVIAARARASVTGADMRRIFHFAQIAVPAAALLAGCLLGGPSKEDSNENLGNPKDTSTVKADTSKTTKTDTAVVVKPDTVVAKPDTVKPVKPETTVVIKPDTTVVEKPDTTHVDTVVVIKPPPPPPPKPTIVAQMLRLETGRVNEAMSGSLAKAATKSQTAAAGPHWSSDFHLTSFKTPITRIVLEDTSSNRFAEIYTCRTGNCLVELVGDELEDILQAVSTEIRPGRYTSVNFNYCTDGASGYESHVTGDVSLNDTLWYTQEGTSLTKTGPATASRIRYQGCGRSFPLPIPVVISEGMDSTGGPGTGATDTSGYACWRDLFDSLVRVGADMENLDPSSPGIAGRCPGEPPEMGGDQGGEPGMPKRSAGLFKRAVEPLIAEPVRFRLFYDLEGLVWAGLNEHAAAWAWAPGNCTGPHPDEAPNDTTPYLCAGYPDIAGTSDSTMPSLERYYLNGSSVFGLFFNSRDDFIGGYSRRYLVEGSSTTPGFEPVTPIRFFEETSTGVFHFGNYGSSVTSSYFETSDFRRGSHTGSFTGERGAAGSYTATLTPPGPSVAP